jgi:hypothetical protein
MEKEQLSRTSGPPEIVSIVTESPDRTVWIDGSRESKNPQWIVSGEAGR